MATKKTITKSNLAKLNSAKASLKKINNNIIDSSFDALKIAIKNGEKWQKLTAKLIKKSEPLREKQVEMFMETADSLKGQFEHGTKRLLNLVGYDEAILEDAKDKFSNSVLGKKTEQISKKLQKEVNETIIITEKLKKEISKTIEDAKEKLETVSEKVKGKFDNVVETVKDKVEDVVEDTIEDAKETIGKVAKKGKEITVDDLKIIHRVGPKMETILNKIGVTSYKELAKMSTKKLDTLLSGAGVNTAVYNLSDWKKQAALAAKGNMDAVTAFIKELKVKK